MSKVHKLFFLINASILGLFGFGTTHLVELSDVYVVYISFTLIHLILLLFTSSINKKKFQIILIMFIFFFIALVNTFIRSHYDAISGWAALSCFILFSFYYIFDKQFDQNLDMIILVIVLGLAITSIYTYFYVVNVYGIIFGLGIDGSSLLESTVRSKKFSGIEFSLNKNYVAKYFFWTLFLFTTYRLQKNKQDYLNVVLFVSLIILTILLSATKLFVIGFISFLIYLISSRQYKTILILTLLSIILFLTFYKDLMFFSKATFNLLNYKFGYFFADDIKSRLSLITNGLKLADDNMLGSGLYYSREQLQTYTHNTFIELIIAMGPIISFFFFIFIYLIFKKLYRNQNNIILLNSILFLSFFQAIYFDFFLLPVVLCFISLHQKQNAYKKN